MPFLSGNAVQQGTNLRIRPRELQGEVVPRRRHPRLCCREGSTTHRSIPPSRKVRTASSTEVRYPRNCPRRATETISGCFPQPIRKPVHVRIDDHSNVTRTSHGGKPQGLKPWRGRRSRTWPRCGRGGWSLLRWEAPPPCAAASRFPGRRRAITPAALGDVERSARTRARTPPDRARHEGRLESANHGRGARSP